MTHFVTFWLCGCMKLNIMMENLIVKIWFSLYSMDLVLFTNLTAAYLDRTLRCIEKKETFFVCIIPFLFCSFALCSLGWLYKEKSLKPFVWTFFRAIELFIRWVNKISINRELNMKNDVDKIILLKII